MKPTSDICRFVGAMTIPFSCIENLILTHARALRKACGRDENGISDIVESA
jgi:hypothetical protein